MSPPNISFDRVADIYDRTRSLPGKVMGRLIEVLTIELDGCKEILDLGTGTGRFAGPLQSVGFDVFGVDISKKMISNAKGKGVKHLLLGDASCLPFKDKTFDATICIHLLHLITEWNKTLREVCRVSQYAMFSLCYAHKDPVREAYDQLLRKQGYVRRRPGKSEQELKDLLNPTKFLFVSSYNTHADDRFVNLEQRTASSQWEIPQSVNLKIVGELKTEFAGKTFRQELYLLMWTIESLKILCS
jgi:ubiquinone/menaquinone biosynthesis C-methylase UbiE